MKSMIHIGVDAEQTKKALPDITKSILQILGSGAGDNVKTKALEVLSGTFKVENVAITNCTLTAKDDK
jgi:hypothetical protein